LLPSGAAANDTASSADGRDTNRATRPDGMCKSATRSEHKQAA